MKNILGVHSFNGKIIKLRKKYNFILGLGQIYGGQGITKGIIFFVIAVVLGALVGVIIFAGIASLLFAIYATYDAYKFLS